MNLARFVATTMFIALMMALGRSHADEAQDCFLKANTAARIATNDAPRESLRYKQAYHEAYKICMPTPRGRTPEKELPILKRNSQKLSDLAADGGELFESWYKKFPSSRTRALGGATNSPSVELCVPSQLWHKATKQQKISLTYYAESLVFEVKKKPEGWVSVPGGHGSAAFEFQTKMLANIQPGAWFVSTARMKPGSYDTASCEDMPVIGDYEWQQEVKKAKENGWKLPPETTKASIFRK